MINYESREAMKALRGPLSKRATSSEFNEWMAREVCEYIDQLRAKLNEVRANQCGSCRGQEDGEGDRRTEIMSDKTIVALIVGAVVTFVAVPLLVASTILSGWVLSILWGWFLSPLGVPSIGIAHGIGLCAGGRLVTGVKGLDDKDRKGWNAFWYSVGSLFGFPLFMLLLGWIAHSFM